MLFLRAEKTGGQYGYFVVLVVNSCILPFFSRKQKGTTCMQNSNRSWIIFLLKRIPQVYVIWSSRRCSDLDDGPFEFFSNDNGCGSIGIPDYYTTQCNLVHSSWFIAFQLFLGAELLS